MKKISLNLLLIVILLCGVFVFPACGPSLTQVYKKIDTIPKGTGLVYIYRPKMFVGSAISYTVSANGTPVVKLYSGGYYPYYSKPGEIIFSAKTEAESSVVVDVEVGKVYFIKGTIGMGVFVGHPQLTLIGNDFGGNEIRSCKLIPEPEEKE